MTGSAVRLRSASARFVPQAFATPLVLSSGTITHLHELRVTVEVESAHGVGVGYGSIYLSDLWAWPEPALTHEQRDAAMQACGEALAQCLPDLLGDQWEHPLELGLRLYEEVVHRPTLPEAIALPILARAVCLSPFDAAIHDAAGIVLGRSAFDLYRTPEPIPSADMLFPGGGAAAAIGAMLRPTPRRTLPAWVVVGKGDDLERDLRPWIVGRGYGCFKLKIQGADPAIDANRTAQVYRFARRHGVRQPMITVDSNEANPDSASVGDYLDCLERQDSDAYAALAYLEQPTGRDIRRHGFDWHPLTRRKPVLVDEGLTGFDLFEEAVDQGWGGFAIKTCKGHSFTLVAAAWARQRGLMLSLQDLTNPTYSAIHAALMGAFVPTVNGAELNSPQFTPGANDSMPTSLAGLFKPSDGHHRLPDDIPLGLGSALANGGAGCHTLSRASRFIP